MSLLFKSESQKMRDEVTALAEEYYNTISSDHHKDRDCHFIIEESWSYGEYQGFIVRHHGYINEFTYGPYKTEIEALKVLEGQLMVMIGEG